MFDKQHHLCSDRQSIRIFRISRKCRFDQSLVGQFTRRRPALDDNINRPRHLLCRIEFQLQQPLHRLDRHRPQPYLRKDRQRPFTARQQPRHIDPAVVTNPRDIIPAAVPTALWRRLRNNILILRQKRKTVPRYRLRSAPALNGPVNTIAELDDPAVRQNRLDALHVISHIPVFQRTSPRRVISDTSTHHRPVTARWIGPDLPAETREIIVQFPQHHPRLTFDNSPPILFADDTVHIPRRIDNYPAAERFPRHTAARPARRDRDPRRRRIPDNRRNITRIPRQNHTTRQYPVNTRVVTVRRPVNNIPVNIPLHNTVQIRRHFRRYILHNVR